MLTLSFELTYFKIIRIKGVLKIYLENILNLSSLLSKKIYPSGFNQQIEFNFLNLSEWFYLFYLLYMRGQTHGLSVERRWVKRKVP